MQLLYSRAAPGPEFVSLSLLLKREISADETSVQMREPLLLPSPASTISQATGVEAIQDLHRYLVSIHRAMRTNNNNTSKMANALLMEDEKLLTDAQVFRPTKGQGIGLHYKLIKDRAAISPLVQLILRSSKTSDAKTSTKAVEKEVAGVILCVGMCGLPSAFAMSSLHYSLSQRMADCIQILSQAGTEDGASCSTLLTSILLTDDEIRLTNSMANAQGNHLFVDDARGKKKNQMSADADFENPLSMNSADQARIMVERLAVLSVAESDTIFRKFEGKQNEKNTKARRRKSGRDADLDGFDFRGESKSSREATSTATSVSDTSSIKSGASKLQLKQPKKDTARVVNAKSRQASVPALMASNKDTGARVRRQSIADNRRQSSDTSQSNWSADNGNGSSSGKNKKFDPFSAHSGDTASTASETTASSRKPSGGFFDSSGPDMPMDAGFGGDAFGQDMGNPMPSGGSKRSGGAARVQVNVALNEDLTCFYKLAKMSSCSVEGVIQVQVKTNAEQAAPFSLSIRDPSSHILSIQENKKFAEDMASTIQQEPPSRRPDYKFTVSVPKGDNYFPVMRYKCGTELRPVPIRVQTRVRLEGSHWRVALQISSNPHNEDNLTDLTIIMGVPPVVRGESLSTSPAGGVWNAAKRSVIWCVSELGGGEKFQLQARFEIDPDVAVDDETPKFPVLVRCQCMFAQLSDVEVDIQEIPEVFPADVRMKVARRFRLSHRERP
jgi:hypothetical protein